MEILFLCRGNVYRSQIAEAFFNEYSSNHNAKSAAIDKPLEKMDKLVIRVMKEKGIDISRSLSEKVTEEMINSSDKIIIMNQDLLDYGQNLPKEKIEIWDVKDSDAKEKDEHKYPELVQGREIIEGKVKDLIRRL